MNGFDTRSWRSWAGGGGLRASVLISILQSTFVSIVVLCAAVLFAARRVRRAWQEEPPSARLQQIEKVFCQPVIWVSFLKRWMQWKLQRNPIGWLEQRRWSGRLVMWTWFAIIVSVQTTALTDNTFFHGYVVWETFLAWLLTISMAAGAAGSFRRERENGVLELLLVSPLTSKQIIGGRLRGLWGAVPSFDHPAARCMVSFCHPGSRSRGRSEAHLVFRRYVCGLANCGALFLRELPAFHHVITFHTWSRRGSADRNDRSIRAI